MFEETAAIPSIWESMNSWLTPTVLFVLLNIMIGTILFTSNLSHPDQTTQNEPQNQPSQSHHHHHHQQQQQHQTPKNKLARSPSVLQRIKSINFYPYRSQEQPSNLTPLFKQTQDNNFSSLDQTLETAATQYVFNQVIDHQQAPNSLTHFSFDQTHLHENLNLQTHYQETDSTNTHFVFPQTHHQEIVNTNTHFVFPHQETQIANTHFVFEQTHYQEPEKTSTQFVFQETHVEKPNLEVDDEFKSLDEVYSQLADRHVSRTTSDTKPAAGEILKKLPEKMKKSASMKSAFSHFEEEKIVEARRPATVRERKAKINDEDVDGEVDAKADDFINKFKHQLKLQRIDSIIRYKDTVTKGAASRV